VFPILYVREQPRLPCHCSLHTLPHPPIINVANLSTTEVTYVKKLEELTITYLCTARGWCVQLAEGLLVLPELPHLPHYAACLVLLDVDVEHHWHLRQPVMLVSEVEWWEALRCVTYDDDIDVWRPNDVVVCQGIDLPAEVGIRPPGLLRGIELHSKAKVSR
jgi:hypothetical protein